MWGSQGDKRKIEEGSQFAPVFSWSCITEGVFVEQEVQGQVRVLAGWGLINERTREGVELRPYGVSTLLGNTRIPYFELMSRGHSLGRIREGNGESHTDLVHGPPTLPCTGVA